MINNSERNEQGTAAIRQMVQPIMNKTSIEMKTNDEHKRCLWLPMV